VGGAATNQQLSGVNSPSGRCRQSEWLDVCMLVFDLTTLFLLWFTAPCKERYDANGLSF
jgi:hypothetical protein